MPLKSAVELAMERLEAESGPVAQLNAGQKREYAEIERKYEAKTAEAKIIRESAIKAAQLAGAGEQVVQLQAELTKEVQEIQAQKELALAKIREQRH